MPTIIDVRLGLTQHRGPDSEKTTCADCGIEVWDKRCQGDNRDVLCWLCFQERLRKYKREMEL